MIPKEMVETDSGPIEPLEEGAREFSVANGEIVPDYGRAFMQAENERGQRGLMQADVSSVNKPLASGSTLANNYYSFVSKGGGVLIERNSWFGYKVSSMLQHWQNNYYNQWKKSTIPMYREGHLYYYYLKKKGPFKQLLPKVSKSVQWNHKSTTEPI